MDEKTEEQLYSPNIAVAAARKRDNRDLSMPWVKDLPVHLLASLFQRMPPELKRQVEMTNHRMAEIMKVHGWRKHDTIDIVIPEHFSGCCRVNDSVDVEIGDVVDCVQLLLARIRVRRFSLGCVNNHPHEELKGVSTAILDALAESKDDGVAISELRLDVPSQLLKPSTVGDVIAAFCDTLTHISTPQLDAIAIGRIGKCDHLKALTVAMDGLMAEEWPFYKSALKGALSAKSSLTSLRVALLRNPLDFLVAGVHQLKHLRMESLTGLRIQEPTGDQAKLMLNLSILELDSFCYDMPKLLNVLRVAPQLERLHVTGKGCVSFNTAVDRAETDPWNVSPLIKNLADECLRSRRSFTFSARFELWKITSDGDGEGMLAAMMEHDKAFVTSPMLSHYGVMAFDERLHEFDANLIPSTAEHATQITDIDGSRVYKRQFKIDVGPGHHLSVAFDESPEVEIYAESEEESDEEGDN